MDQNLMQVQPPHGFIVLNGIYFLVGVAYVGANPQGPTPNWEYQSVIADALCDLGNVMGALPLPTDVVSVSMPNGDYVRCVVRHRYFSITDLEADITNGIVPNVIVKFIVDGDI